MAAAVMRGPYAKRVRWSRKALGGFLSFEMMLRMTGMRQYRPFRDGLAKGSDRPILLKKSEIEVPRKSHLSAYSVVYVGSCQSNAY